MKGIKNPEEEVKKEFEKKRRLRVKARQKYNEVSANFKSVEKNQKYKYIV